MTVSVPGKNPGGGESFLFELEQSEQRGKKCSMLNAQFSMFNI
jgi:hypothetical protein